MSAIMKLMLPLLEPDSRASSCELVFRCLCGSRSKYSQVHGAMSSVAVTLIGGRSNEHQLSLHFPIPRTPNCLRLIISQTICLICLVLPLRKSFANGASESLVLLSLNSCMSIPKEIICSYPLCFSINMKWQHSGHCSSEWVRCCAAADGRHGLRNRFVQRLRFRCEILCNHHSVDLHPTDLKLWSSKATFVPNRIFGKIICSCQRIV